MFHRQAMAQTCIGNTVFISSGCTTCGANTDCLTYPVSSSPTAMYGAYDGGYASSVLSFRIDVFVDQLTGGPFQVPVSWSTDGGSSWTSYNNFPNVPASTSVQGTVVNANLPSLLGGVSANLRLRIEKLPANLETTRTVFLSLRGFTQVNGGGLEIAVNTRFSQAIPTSRGASNDPHRCEI